MRKTYDLKQVKISTSILWLLNKADARNVFYSSLDIFSNKSKLHLHSLIIRGLISGELYCAALCKLFPSHNTLRTARDFQTILNFLIELDTFQLTEMRVIKQKNQEAFIKYLTGSEPFELSEHLQMIDAVMGIYLALSEPVLSIPLILGKLCDYRPNCKEPKTLLEIWFKCLTCLALSKNNIMSTKQLIKCLITQETLDQVEKEFLDSIKFSDKIALIMSYESDALEIEKAFVFDFSPDGSTDRENVKHNFIAVIQNFRKHFPKVLEDFKELMLVLNSSHIQVSNNLHINIDLFILEFFIHLEEICNHGNRTFRTDSQILDLNETSTSRTFRVENPISNKVTLGNYQSLNKSSILPNDKYSKFGAFGTYSGRKHSQMENNSSVYDEQSTNWTSHKSGKNLLTSARKSSVPNGLNMTGINKSISSNLLISDGSLKSKFLESKVRVEKSQVPNNGNTDTNQTSWLLENEKAIKNKEPFSKDDINNQENEGPRFKLNETRLRLNLKRQEIEENRRQLQNQLTKERQLLTDQVFKDVTMGISQIEIDENNRYRPKRVSDMKRGRKHQDKSYLTRSRSQDLSNSSMDHINVSLNELKSEITKLTSEQARLSAKIGENNFENGQPFSPRLENNAISKEDTVDNKTTERSSIRSMPASWHPHKAYLNEDEYNSFQRSYVMPYPYQMKNQSNVFHPPVYNPYQNYMYNYPSENYSYQVQQPFTVTNPHHMTKSLRDNVSSRPGSPGAMSEPSKITEVKLNKDKESEILTIQNLMKHNQSMEALPRDIIYLENGSNKSKIETASKKNDVNSTTGSVLGSSIHKFIQNNINNVNQDHVNSENLVKSSSENSCVKSVSSIELKNKIEKNTQEIKNPENFETYFVSFGEDKPLRANPINSRKKNEKKLDEIYSNKKPESTKNVTIATSIKCESKPKPKVDKALAFVITADDDMTSGPISDNNSVTKDKLLQITEKREQERKEKLEKIREATKIENEKRLLKELEKEKLKEERKLKREAIFEAHLEKKLEKEANENQSRKEVKTNKRPPHRAISAAPSFHRNDLNLEVEQSLFSNNHSPDGSSPNSRREKLPLNLFGPKLFVEPKSKSNKNVILNAIKYCCLAGKVNEPLKLQTLEELDRFDAIHFMILMRGGCQYRSLYKFEFESECLTKLSGTGPKKITNKMVEKFFKYNSGAKKFMEITSTNHLSTVIDGITIFNILWKSNNSQTNQAISSETSSQAEHVSQ